MENIIWQENKEGTPQKKLSLKDIQLHCVGYRGYDDEWYPDNRYEQKFKLGKHHYRLLIIKLKEKKWTMSIYLCLTAVNSDNILVAKHNARTMKALKQLAVDEINAYQDSDKCDEDIEDWKKANGKPVFDKDFKYLGVTYTSPSAEADERFVREYGYYNDRKPEVGYGTYYMLDKFDEQEKVMICEIGYGCTTTKWSDDKELVGRLKKELEE